MNQCEPDECITLEADNWTETERDLFCDAHETLNPGVDGCCQGSDACAYWQSNAQITLCKGACTGLSACEWAGATVIDAPITFTYGPYSCLGGSSCAYIGGSYGKRISIGQNACVDDFACKKVGYSKAKFVDIGDSSCVGYQSCYVMGYHESSFIAIDQSQCIGTYECHEYNMDEGYVLLYA